MNIHDRIKLVIKWLIGTGVSNNQENIGRLLGYTNKSSFSQVLNNKVPIPEDFINKLCRLDPKINKIWIENEVGSMLCSESLVEPIKTTTPPIVSIPLDEESVIYKMYLDEKQEKNRLLKEKEDKINELNTKILILTEEIGNLKAQLNNQKGLSGHSSTIERVSDAFTQDSFVDKENTGEESPHMRNPISPAKSSHGKL